MAGTPGVGPPPEYLNPNAKKLWNDLVEQLGEELLNVDRAMFELMCAAYGAAQAALEDLNDRGPLIRGRSKDHSADGEDGEAAFVKNPSNQVAREMATQFREFGKEFGLSPGARKRISMELKKKKPNEDSPDID